MVKKRSTVLQRLVDAMVILLLVSGAFVAMPDEVLGQVTTQISAPVQCTGCLGCNPTTPCSGLVLCYMCPCKRPAGSKSCVCNQSYPNGC